LPYVPSTPAPAAPALAPVGLISDAPALLAIKPLDTELKLRDSELNVLDGHRATVSGTLLEGHHSGRPGRLVALQALGRRGWRTLVQAHTSTGGRFRVSYTPRNLGSEQVRLRFAGSDTDRASHRRLGRLNVFRIALASWYGGGGGMACGGELTSSTLGVANKTLPCGTLITLRYGGRSIRVPVVDRGPYVAGREFDLTEATKSALGFDGVGDVWSTS
jgi:rare lipoprotein A